MDLDYKNGDNYPEKRLLPQKSNLIRSLGIVRERGPKILITSAQITKVIKNNQDSGLVNPLEPN